MFLKTPGSQEGMFLQIFILPRQLYKASVFLNLSFYARLNHDSGSAIVLSFIENIFS